MNETTKHDIQWALAFLGVALMWLFPAILIVMGWA